MRNSFSNIVGSIVRILLGIISVPFIISGLGIKDYGVWTMCISIVGFLFVLEAGLTNSGVYFLSKTTTIKDPALKKETFTNYLILFSIGILLFTLISVFIFHLAFSNIATLLPQFSEREINLLRNLNVLFITNIILGFLNYIPLVIIQVFEKYVLKNIIEVIAGIFRNLALILVAYYVSDIYSLMIINVSFAAILLVFNSVIIFRTLLAWVVKVKLYLTANEVIEFIKYSFYSWLSSISSILFSQGDKLIVGSLLGSSSLGVYGALTLIGNYINGFSATAISPYTPKLIKSLAEKDKNQYGRIIKEMVALSSIFSIAFGAILILGQDWIRKIILFDIPYNLYYGNFILVIVIYSTYSFHAIGYFLLQAMGEAKKLAIIQGIATILSLIGVYIFSKFFGLNGAIWGNGIFNLIGITTIMSFYKLGINLWESFAQISHTIIFFFVIAALAYMFTIPWYLSLLFGVMYLGIVFREQNKVLDFKNIIRTLKFR